jgi:hypothetical protein
MVINRFGDELGTRSVMGVVADRVRENLVRHLGQLGHGGRPTEPRYGKGGGWPSGPIRVSGWVLAHSQGNSSIFYKPHIKSNSFDLNSS